MIASGWKYYLPDYEEVKDDAQDIMIYDWQKPPRGAKRAAKLACEDEWSNRSGLERGEDEFKITVISPSGEETSFMAWHEHSVEHMVRLELDEHGSE